MGRSGDVQKLGTREEKMAVRSASDTQSRLRRLYAVVGAGTFAAHLDSV